MSFAKVSIVGNLGRDPETRYTPSGALNVQFTIAASGRRRGGEQGADQDNTTWFRVTAWDRLAERIVNMMERGYLGKGKLLYVEGQLESRQFTGNDGQQRTSLEVTMTDFQFVGSRQDSQGGGQGGQSYGSGNQDSGFSGGQGGYGGGSYGGSNYGNQGGDLGSDEGQENLNDVPF